MQQIYSQGGSGVVVTSVVASQRHGTKLVDISYNLVNPQGTPVAVAVQVSADNGRTLNVPAATFSGSGYGSSVTPGINRQIVWNAGADWNNQFSCQTRFRISAGGDAPVDSEAVTVDTRDSLAVDQVSFSPASLNPGQNIQVSGIWCRWTPARLAPSCA